MADESIHRLPVLVRGALAVGDEDIAEMGANARVEDRDTLLAEATRPSAWRRRGRGTAAVCRRRTPLHLAPAAHAIAPVLLLHTVHAVNLGTSYPQPSRCR